MVDAPSVLDRIRTYLDRQRDAIHAVGLSVAITDRERTLGTLNDGFANAEARVPVREDQLFQIGSISKGFTAIALLRESELGRLDLEAPVTDYLPWFRVRSRFGPIAVHHLLAHTGGLVPGTESTGEAVSEVWALRETETGFEPGERMVYSNVGYKALGLILERVTGRPWWEVVRDRILEPLEMTRTEPIVTHETRRRLAVGYEPFYDDRPWQPRHGFAPAAWLETATADGTICATAEELCFYLRLLLNEGRPILSAQSFARMTRPNRPDPEAPEEVYGYGVKWIELGDRRLLGHSGSTVGYRAYALCEPATGFGVAIVCTGPGVRLPLARFALDLLRASALGEPLPEVPQPEDPREVPDADAYAGVYRSPAGERAHVVAEGGGLTLELGGGRAALQRTEAPDAFTVEDPELDRFELRFAREEGVVTELVHGPRWMTHERSRGPDPRPDPPRTQEVAGHYRSHNPWLANLRVFARRGELWLQDPAEGERPLAPLGDGSYRVGEPWSPERVRFDSVVEGRATRMIYDTAALYRTFTP